MRVGMTFFCQNAEDWDRYESEERGEPVASQASIPDRQIFLEEVELAKSADALGFDTVWTVEHHFTPYTMVTNPLQVLTYLAGVTKNVDLGTMVVVLPWHNPVRVAEDAAVQDDVDRGDGHQCEYCGDGVCGAGADTAAGGRAGSAGTADDSVQHR